MNLKPILIVTILKTWPQLRIVSSQWNRLFVNSYIVTMPLQKSWYTRVGLMWPKSSSKKSTTIPERLQAFKDGERKMMGYWCTFATMNSWNCSREWNGCGGSKIYVHQFPYHPRELLFEFAKQIQVLAHMFMSSFWSEPL